MLDFTEQTSNMETIKETIRTKCAETVRGPGKFEGEPIYAPYFYDIEMNGDGDHDGNEIIHELEPIDIYLFPELEGHKRVRTHESDSGFFYLNVI